MSRYREGKWPPNGSTDEVDAEVMKFIGRTEFISTTSPEVTAPVTENDYIEESIQTGVHQVLFEYMQHFENQAGQVANAHSAYPAQDPTSYPPQEQDIILQVLPELAEGGTLESFLSSGLFGNNGHHSEPLNLSDQTNSSTKWPPNSLYSDPSVNSSLLDGYGPNTFSIPLNDLLLDQGDGSRHSNEQVSQDQVWEQLLSGLMS
jgi:hypothetical protein